MKFILVCALGNFRDAEDAVRGRDGYLFDGYRIRVEFPRSSSKGESRGGGGGGNRGYGNFSGRASRPKGYQLIVTGLPPTGSWQDVKDHFREAGDIIFADVFRDGKGVVEFSRQEHAKRALRDLDDSKFRSHEVSVCRCYILRHFCFHLHFGATNLCRMCEMM